MPHPNRSDPLAISPPPCWDSSLVGASRRGSSFPPYTQRRGSMRELLPAAQIAPAPERVRSVTSVPTGPRLVDLFRVPSRYLRSVHLERDFDDIDSLRHYSVTPPMV